MIWATVGAEFLQERPISAQERKGTWFAPTVRQTVMTKSTILMNWHFFLQLHGLHRPELPEIPCKNALYPVMSDAVTFKYEEARGRWDLVRWWQLDDNEVRLSTMMTIGEDNDGNRQRTADNNHYSQENHCNDNCNAFSDYNDIIAPLVKLINTWSSGMQ